MKELTFEKVWKDLMDLLRQDPMVYTLARRKTNKVTAIVKSVFPVGKAGF